MEQQSTLKGKLDIRARLRLEKGKLRTLLARSMTEGYILNAISEDCAEIRRLFGAAAKGEAGGRASRLQFYDIRMNAASAERLGAMELDTYIGEVKWENAIDRITAAANPRQIERVPAGADFDFRLVYNIEREDELPEDMQLLGEGLRLLQMDYLGGHGSRGYGRLSLREFSVEYFSLSAQEAVSAEQCAEIAQLLEKGGRLS